MKRIHKLFTCFGVTFGSLLACGHLRAAENPTWDASGFTSNDAEIIFGEKLAGSRAEIAATWSF